ncbi:hypothetical protein LINGRAHAP2_LOCUS4533 [Linum grandiflorum]
MKQIEGNNQRGSPPLLHPNQMEGWGQCGTISKDPITVMMLLFQQGAVASALSEEDETIGHVLFFLLL